ncbi:uncharacterized protein LOC132272631 [Cornus florida]|uniref:uncharacterized protein LOC132272631 n=1 Tax=Cornus florida TaxID=4283 RepID=UPI00289EF7E1|nr:uncharacterized protein LOC132272631 [Cornus florida]
MQTLSRIHTFKGRPIIIKQWDKNVNLPKEVLESVPVWLKIHNLPVHCHNEESVSKVCSNFSKPIYMDDPDLHRDKGDYVRVMVEVGVKEVLPETMVVDIHSCDYFIDLEYEWKPKLCDLCKKVDHLEDRFPLKILQMKPKKGVDKWVMKNKGKLIAIDEVIDEMPARAHASASPKLVQVSNSFAALSDKEDNDPNKVEPVVEENIQLTNQRNEKVVEITSDVEIYSPVGLDIVSSAARFKSSEEQEKVQDNTDARAAIQNDLSSTGNLSRYIRKMQVMPNWFWINNYEAHGLGKIWVGWNPVVLDVKALDIKDQSMGPWITLGDWNAIRFHGDKKGELLEISAINGEWSWNNRQRAIKRICVKLDRVFLNNHWLNQITSTKMTYSAAKSSDHYGILVQVSKNFATGPKPFKMLKIWCLKDAVLPLVEHAWQMEKLEDLQQHLLVNPSESLFEAEYKLREEYEASISDQEILLAQKSKTLWLKDNDSYTAFFHQKIKQHRNFNAITSIESADGQILKDSQDIGQRFVDYYQNLFSKQVDSQVGDFVPRHTLSADDNFRLDAPIQYEEVRDVVMGFHLDKSPGLDGFPARFYQTFWQVIDKDVVAAVQYFFNFSIMLLGVSSSFLMLLPKIGNASKVGDFRPIALCNLVYKIITKIMANRLALSLPKLVGVEQCAFVKGRRIQNALIIAHDMVRDFNNPKHPSMALKVDIIKAYGLVSWEFLLKALGFYGFSNKWINWVAAIFQSTRYSILLNGSPKGFIKPGRGLRQGCPLSPLLFTLVTECLSTFIAKAAQKKNLAVINSIKTFKPHLCHIFFADDLMVACKATIHNARVLASIFKKFEAVTGLQVSPLKSSVIFSRAVKRKSGLLEVLQYKEESFPIKYLGLPLYSTGLKKSHCKDLIDNIANKIFCWNSNLLSVAGKLELIKAVITPIFQYWCFIFDIPMAVINQIQKMCRDYLWGSKEHAKKLHLLKWAMITRTKEEGGLGIRKLIDIQVASKCVLVWDFLTSKDRLWISWFKHKYTPNCNYWAVVPRMSNSVIWKTMVAVREMMLQHCGFQISNGRSILLFKDPWCAGLTVTAKFGHRMVQNLNLPRDASLSAIIQNGVWNWQMLQGLDLLPFRQFLHFLTLTMKNICGQENPFLLRTLGTGASMGLRKCSGSGCVGIRLGQGGLLRLFLLCWIGCLLCAIYKSEKFIWLQDVLIVNKE